MINFYIFVNFAKKPYRIFRRILNLINKKLKLFYKKQIKYRGYNPPFGIYGEGMPHFANLIKKHTTLKVRNIFEIGANFGQDADSLMKAFNLTADQIYVFEAHPELYQAIKKIHKFNAYNYAVFNEEKNMTFNIVPMNFHNNGISSIYNLPEAYKTKEVVLKSIRMDNFMREYAIEKIDFLKLDVEGASYEVLEGFGNRLRDVNSMHIEAEHGPSHFHGATKYFDVIEELLKNNGFEMLYFRRDDNSIQSDSFWVQKNILINR